ncbi:armadillo/beta-catenin-like repeat protein [Senna tora]|uniref:Armadillo/beta-catenin-like repeat protein n=1 Tax=Senna tora TaxID=362788 RepID=A0A834TCU8_9FABA|nr:armadillo/beta-catenin-like repeat protein [Senna tora]
MEGGREESLWKSEPAAESIVSVTLARAMSVLLSARPKKLQEAISLLSSLVQRPSTGSLEDSLWFLHKYVSDAAEKDDSFDQVLVPMIENSLKSKDSKHGAQALILINWFFQDELLFEPVTKGLASIITRKSDHFLLFGWCIFVRAIVECENSSSQAVFSGIRERYNALLDILSTCLPHLAGILSEGSTMQDGFELPSRLGVSAADCFLTLTEALTIIAEVRHGKLKSNTRETDQAITLVPSNYVKKVKLASKSLMMSKNEKDYILCHHLDGLICLLQRLLSWSKKSRFLHAKGLEQVLKWLEEIKIHYGSLQYEADSKVLKTGDLLLSSCWKHYSRLLYLEDKKFPHHYRELLDQYLSGIQYYMDNHTCGLADKKDGEVETRKFFLNCLCLLLGRLDNKRFESTVLECGIDISRVLVPQLTCTDEDVIVGVVSIFKAIILRPTYSTGNTIADNRHADAVMPFLLHVLDEQDGTARAVVMLIAEYYTMSEDDKCFKEVLKRLDSGNFSQRRNAIDVISEVIRISTDPQMFSLHSAWQDVANLLLERLGDQEIVIREQASKLLLAIDPSLYLPALVGLVYSTNEIVQSSAVDAFIGVLKCHHEKIEVLFLLLDCLGCTASILFLLFSLVSGSKLDPDRVLKLIPKWSKSVRDWKFLIGPLIDKMFSDPSNAIIVKFMSYISENLVAATDQVLHKVLMHVRGQKEIDVSFLSRWENRNYTSDEFVDMQRSLFEHLCPLLIIKMLPLKVFSDLNSSIIYGHLNQNIVPDTGGIENGYECIAALLLDRAFREFEFEDVRKLAAELCGRIHPQVLFPVLCSKLEQAVDNKNILKIKACLLSICTSLVVRGWESFSHPAMLAIRKMIETVLLWPSVDADSVSKAQHGCIDCLALMICAELQAEKSVTNKNNISVLGVSVVTYVISQFLNDKKDLSQASQLDSGCSTSAAALSLPFRLCMANVLISACQKISNSGRKPFAAQVLPSLIHSVESIVKSEIRTACIQVLFSAVYHLRSAVLPYASDLLRISLKALRKESEKERMAGAKLMASLMASEDIILESISVGLLEARSVLSTISLSDPSPEMQQLCRKLLACISST